MHERKGKEMTQTRKREGGMEGQREVGRVRGRERQREDKQTEPNSAQTEPKVQPGSCAGKGNRELLYPQEVIWMSKGQAAKVLSGLANPSQGKEASGT